MVEQKNLEASPLLTSLVSKYPELEKCVPDIVQAVNIMKQTYHRGGKVLLCGNGGSASDCEHIVGELMKGFMSKRPLSDEKRKEFLAYFPDEGDDLADHLQGALPAISLVSHTALMTAYANDVAADMVFAQQVYGFGQRGDVLLSLSTSGNSANVIKAVQVAKVIGLHTIGFTGKQGGRLKELCDVTVCVPRESTPEIQERHLPIYHALCILLEEEFFPS